MDKVQPTVEQRHVYKHEGRTVYSWDQTISDVNIYIELPEGLSAKALAVEIKPTHLSVGIKGNPPYLSKELGGLAKASESVWTVDGRELHVQLAKARSAEAWPAALAGHAPGAAAAAADQRRLVLERFQEEHPGFDFSGAEITGAVPDPATFLRDIPR